MARDRDQRDSDDDEYDDDGKDREAPGPKAQWGSIPLLAAGIVTVPFGSS